jgi:cytochrome c-type protein NapC
MTLKRLVVLLGALAVLGVFAIASWSLTESAIQATSDTAFCGVCHSMKPFVETHLLDVHGGQNPKGLSAACADCHLPHDSPTTYLLAKVRMGVYDVGAELVAFFREPDWIGKLQQRQSFVHDSGCLKCHAHLDRLAIQTTTAAFAHKLYLTGGSGMQCVTCHLHVGHKDLLARLSPGLAVTDSAPAPATASQEQAP